MLSERCLFLDPDQSRSKRHPLLEITGLVDVGQGYIDRHAERANQPAPAIRKPPPHAYYPCPICNESVSL